MPKYELLQRLGEGGMGSVYLAKEVALGRVVAIKVLAPLLARDGPFRMRFEREARAAAGLSHPNVVQVYTVGETEGDPSLPFIIMQYVEGATLDDVLQEAGPLSERRARRVLRDVAAGLAAAHARDLVHRDIKPANILLEHSSGRAFIADFGISAALSPRAIGGAEPVPEAGVVMGTPPYMSPEQTLGEVLGPASDVYSLGIVAYQVLSGALPFETNSPQGWMGAHRAQTPIPLRNRRKGISDDLVRLVDRCLVKESQARPHAAELARELLPSTEDEILWPPPGLVELPALGRKLRRASLLLLAGAGVLFTVLALRVPGAYTGTGWWTAWAGGPIVAVDAAAPSAGVVALWQAVVLLSGVVLAGALSWFLWLTGQTRTRLAELAARGWLPETLRDVIADPDGRSGLLLSGAGEFAMLSPERRASILGVRRAQHRGLLLAATWPALLLAVWAVSVLLGRPLQARGGTPVGGPQFFAIVVPTLLALFAAAAALLREKRATGITVWRRQHSGTFAIAKETGEEDIAAWYADLPGSRGPARPRSPPARTWTAAARLFLIAVAVLTVSALALLLTATLLAGRSARQLGPATSRLAELVEQRENGDTLAGIRLVLREYQPPPRSPDTAGSGLEALQSTSLTLPAYPVEPRAALGSRQPGLASRTLVADAMRRAGRLGSDTLRLLEQLADHPRTRFLRRAAASATVTLPREADSTSAIRTAMEANAAAAVLAAARRDFGAAASRLGENAVVADAALRAGGRAWPTAGLQMLSALVLLPLAEVERLRDDPEREARLRTLAVGIGESIDRFGPRWVRGGIGLASDPRDLRVLLLLKADSTIPRGFREAALEASGGGVCLNPREWLAGADPARREVLRELPALPPSFESGGILPVAARIRYCAGLLSAGP